MMLSLDLPKSKWESLLPYLEPYIEESEVVEKLCNAVRSTQLQESLAQRMYGFFITHSLPIYEVPTVRKIMKFKGGAKLAKEIGTTIGMTEAKKAYFQFLQDNFTMELKK